MTGPSREPCSDQSPTGEHLKDALLRGDRAAALALKDCCGAAALTERKNGLLQDLTCRYLAGALPFCQLTAAAHAACVFSDPSLPPAACCGAAAGNTTGAGRDYMLMLLSAWGVPALDLGTDVSPEAFLSAVTGYGLQYAVCMVFSSAEGECVRHLDALARERGVRGSFRLVVCGADPEEHEALRDLPADFLTRHTAAAAQWVMNTWKS